MDLCTSPVLGRVRRPATRQPGCSVSSGRWALGEALAAVTLFATDRGLHIGIPGQVVENEGQGRRLTRLDMECRRQAWSGTKRGWRRRARWRRRRRKAVRRERRQPGAQLDDGNTHYPFKTADPAPVRATSELVPGREGGGKRRGFAREELPCASHSCLQGRILCQPIISQH